MKKQERKTIRDKSLKELEKMAVEKAGEIQKARAELTVGRHKNVRIVKTLRLSLARIKTILRERELKGEAAETK